jgi:hypothetical protein
MKLRRLRLVFSATCLIGYAVLIVLWVRSYSSDDFVIAFIPKHRVVDIGSECGVLRITTTCIRNRELEPRLTISSGRFPTPVERWDFDRSPDRLGNKRIAIRFPHWFAVLLAPAMAAAPWFRWRKN